jgi:hypothetical protein
MVISKPDFNPYDLGQADAQSHLQSIQNGKQLILTLAWGQPCNSPVIGAYAYDIQNTCHSTSEFQTQIQSYLDGYCAEMQSIQSGPSGHYCGYPYNTQQVPVILAFGPNNCVGGPNCSNASNDPSNAVNYLNGQQWGTIVSNIASYASGHGYGYQIAVVGAMDIEGSWNTYSNTIDWLHGFVNADPYDPVYNFGDCGCPDTYSPSGPFKRDWDYNKIHEVTYRATILGDAIPEIYHNSGVDAQRWQGLSKWAANNTYGKIIFYQLLTTSGTCGQGSDCTSISNAPIDAINQMTQALNADSQTANGLRSDVRSTDISWYPSK